MKFKYTVLVRSDIFWEGDHWCLQNLGKEYSPIKDTDFYSPLGVWSNDLDRQAEYGEFKFKNKSDFVIFSLKFGS